MEKLDTLYQKSYRFLFLLLLIDFLFIILEFVYHYTDILQYSIYSITADRSYAEMFQYIKEIWIIALLGLFFMRTKEVVYFLWSFIFGYFLIDDSFKVHENMGELLADKIPFDMSSIIKMSHVGELAFFIVLAVVFVIPLFCFHIRLNESNRGISETLLKLVIVLAIFGVAVDVIHGLFEENGFLNVFLGALEDGGEMIVMSVIVWYCYFLHDYEDNILE